MKTDLRRFLFRLIISLGLFAGLVFIIKSIPSADHYFKTSGPVYLLSGLTAQTTKAALYLAGYESVVSYSYDYTDVIDQGVFVVNIPGSPGIWIGGHCLGLKLLLLFVVLIVSFPGPWKPKLLYITGGVLLIELLYIWRLAYLVIISHRIVQSGVTMNMSEIAGRVHDNLNTGLYILIVVLFVIYARFFSRRRSASGMKKQN